MTSLVACNIAGFLKYDRNDWQTRLSKDEGPVCRLQQTEASSEVYRSSFAKDFQFEICGETIIFLV